MAKKIKCYVNNRVVELSEAAFKIASRSFGATEFREMKLPKPEELMSKPLPKPDELMSKGVVREEAEKPEEVKEKPEVAPKPKKKRKPKAKK